MTLLLRVLLAIFVLSFAFDYKGVEGGSAFQYAMAAANTAAFLAIGLWYRLALPRHGLASFVFWSWVAFLLVGSLAAITGGVPLSQYIRTIYPFALYAEGFLVAWWTSRSPVGAAALIGWMLLVSLVSCVFTIWWGFRFSGAGLETIRHQILSPTTPFVIVVAGYDLLLAHRRIFRALAMLTLSLGVVFLAVTRGELLAVTMVTAAFLGAAVWNILRRESSVPGRVYRAIAWGIIAGPVGIIVAAATAPSIAYRWIERSLSPASSVTIWTRIASIVGQWGELTAGPVAFFLGRGFGQGYYYAPAFAPLIIPAINPAAYSAGMWYPGEFMWVSPLYYGGALAGSLVIIGLLWGAVRGLGTLSELMRHRTWALAVARPIWVGALGYFAFLGLGFTANPFIMRLSALFMGLTLGVFLSATRSLRDIHKGSPNIHA